MEELRKDPTRGQWVLIRPKREATQDGACPFCPGAEHLTGGEIAAYRKEGSPPNSSDWIRAQDIAMTGQNELDQKKRKR